MTTDFLCYSMTTLDEPQLVDYPDIPGQLRDMETNTQAEPGKLDNAMTREYIPDLEALIDQAGVEIVDLVLAGDGSGTTTNESCGFACVAYDRRRGEVFVHKGGFSHGTNNLAELMPYVHALWYYQANNKFSSRPVRVLIVSDSELTVRQGQRKYRREANACLWAAIDWFEQNGFYIHWRHVYRNTNPVNAACDKFAGRVRKSFADGPK